MTPAQRPAQSGAAPCLRPEGLAFLRNLARHNDREWFQPRKAEFDAVVRAPMLAIVTKITDAMLDFAPRHVRPAEKSLFRIYRDTRFSADKRPYKTHIAAWWAHHGIRRTSGAGYYLHVSAKEVVIAAGVYMPEKEELALIRHWLLDHHEAFRRLIARPAVRRVFTEFEGRPLSRPPRGFPGDHPALDLIRCRQWGLSATLPAQTALDPGFTSTVIRYLRLAAPVVDALNAPITAPLKANRTVLFGLR